MCLLISFRSISISRYQATVHMCGIEDGRYKDQKIHFWEDVYGFDMRYTKWRMCKGYLLPSERRSAPCTSSQEWIPCSVRLRYASSQILVPQQEVNRIS